MGNDIMRTTRQAKALRVVAGYCPMGCGASLAVRVDGQVYCWEEDCPRPSAIHEILCVPETEHLVLLAPLDFTVQHPLRERLDGELFHCSMHAHIKAMDGPPHPPGTYRVTGTAGQYDWELV